MQVTADLKNKLTDAKLCCETGDYERAYKLYADVRDASASHAEADAGLEFVRLAIKEHVSPGTLCQLVYRLMLHEYQKGSYQHGLHTGRLCLVDEPEIYAFWELLGATSLAARETVFALQCFEKAVSLSPRSAQANCNLGVAYKSLGQLAQAESAYRTAISLDSNKAEPLNNLGNLLIEMGRAEEAIYLLKAALKLQPEYGDAHINLGIAYRKVGSLNRALQSFQVAVGLNIGDAKLQNNLGVTLQMLGSNEEAMIAFALASKINPENMEANENLAALLTVLTPSESIRGPIVKAHSDVRVAHSLATSNESPIESAVQYIKDIMACFPADHPQFRTSLSQIYRRSDRDLNCGRHKSVFDKHGVIPEFCFGCYKLQIEPRNVIDLVKLFLFFEEIDLKNIRKCFVELRPEINGFYKGLIYCDSVDEADELEEKLLPKLRERVAGYLALDLKRGCSEYPLRYPEYAHINRLGPQLMNYRNEWKDVEAKHDDTYLNLRPKLILPTLRGASLQDATVIRKWFDYAKGLDDISHEALRFREILYPEVYEVGKRRRTQFSAFIEKPADQKAKG